MTGGGRVWAVGRSPTPVAEGGGAERRGPRACASPPAAPASPSVVVVDDLDKMVNTDVHHLRRRPPEPMAVGEYALPTRDTPRTGARGHTGSDRRRGEGVREAGAARACKPPVAPALLGSARRRSRRRGERRCAARAAPPAHAGGRRSRHPHRPVTGGGRARSDGSDLPRQAREGGGRVHARAPSRARRRRLSCRGHPRLPVAVALSASSSRGRRRSQPTWSSEVGQAHLHCPRYESSSKCLPGPPYSSTKMKSYGGGGKSSDRRPASREGRGKRVVLTPWRDSAQSGTPSSSTPVGARRCGAPGS